MKVLFVASFNSGRFVPFIVEQSDAIRQQGLECERFGIEGKGIIGYLKNLRKLKNKIQDFKPDIIHAHYGFSGLLANMQRRVPVVTTYHGSDINEPRILMFSKLCMRLSRFDIFVSEKNAETAGLKKNFIVQPCGIDIECFAYRTKDEARRSLAWDANTKYIVFAGAFDNKVKNAALAKESVALLGNVNLVELKRFGRSEVANVFYAADALLMTSFTEGSPQVIKEAMACGCPIVSVDVGDVRNITQGIEGCYISERNAESIAADLRKALSFEGRTNGRERILKRGLTNEAVAKKIIDVYKSCIYDNFC